MEGGTTNVPGDLVPSTRNPWPSVTTSPVQRYTMARVARVSRVSFTENCTGLPASMALPDGVTISNGTFFRSVSISCTGTGRDSNLYDFPIESRCPYRAIYNTQGWLASGASPVKCWPLYFFCSSDSPVAGLSHSTS